MRPTLPRLLLALSVASSVPFAVAHAATDLGLVTGTTGFTTLTSNGDFGDFYNFTVAPNNSAGLAATTVSFANYGALVSTLTLYTGSFSMPSQLVGLTSISLNQQTAISTPPGGPVTTTVSGNTFSTQPLTAYTLYIQGNSKGAAAYTGLVALTPVPEPETYAMLFAGLGMLGMMIRRRSGGR